MYIGGHVIQVISLCLLYSDELRSCYGEFERLAPCSLSFSDSGSRSGSRIKMNNFWTIISRYLSKKTWLLYTLTSLMLF